MRASFILGFKDKTKGKRVFPKDYRRRVLAHIKECVKTEDANLKQLLWGTKDNKKNIVKPFTFSVYLPDAKKADNQIVFTADSITLTVSSSSLPIENTDITGYSIFIALYNGLVRHKHHFSIAFGDTSYDFYLKNSFMHKENSAFSFTEKGVLFKTLSPVIIRKLELGKKPEWLAPGHDEYEVWLSHSVKGLVKKFLKRGDFDFSFTPVDVKETYVNHYGCVVPGMSGSFYVNAPFDVVKLIFDVGLGAKRSGGFGMVEVGR